MRGRALLLGLLAFATGGCETVLGLGGLVGTGGGGSGGGGGTASGSTVAPECTDATDCPAVPPGPCASLGQRTCTGGVCGVTYQAGDAPSQVYGDCHRNGCDTTGNLTRVVDDTDVFDSGNECVPYECTGGMLMEKIMPGAVCVLPGALLGTCQPIPDPKNPGVFVCSQCDPGLPTSCAVPPGMACDQGTCKPTHCTSGTKDGNETDKDCGGPDCLPCDTGKICKSYTDCFSQVCTGGFCQAPSCTDDTRNGPESDVDCGGSCPPCDDTRKCHQPGDCKSGVCRPTGTNVPDRCAAPTCTDGVQNGGETGVDCGGDADSGHVCPPCAR